MKIYVGGPRSKKYHGYPHCDGLNSSWLADTLTPAGDVHLISRVDAIGRGLEPCKKCNPPPLLWSAS